ncbi:Hypothetical protein CKL_0673 [Clostridium kluyveri DSM 555]|uniref:Uncharacterized protein n=1 Tax=Clostridium kluyveri (strain ATCC 8527 / DSM 555 / NBRC 12016 / NCIMB 10680 / K1) TaxID=431943 RepID=A5N5Z5_CLOK5|nr:Hypothetical protein CKL_0673 [Clostridium kluyveri DSM 555]
MLKGGCIFTVSRVFYLRGNEKIPVPKSYKILFYQSLNFLIINTNYDIIFTNCILKCI